MASESGGRSGPGWSEMITRADVEAFWEIKAMRVLAILALALSLAGCNGDRIKDSNLQPPPAPAGGGLFA
jgi:hypothetical protein